MLRLTRSVFATTSTGKAGGAGVKRKSKWIDRRSKTPPHDGKEIFPYNAQPSCTLCHMKFKYKQDYATHTESDTHKARAKWVETMTWWEGEGKPALTRYQAREWDWFVENVAKPEAEKVNISVDKYIRRKGYRTAKIDDDVTFHTAIQAPITKPEVSEPRDNRWPMSPKW